MRRTKVAAVVVTGGVLAMVAAILAPVSVGSTNNPQWVINGTQLPSPETREVIGEGSGTQTLLTSSASIQCSTQKLEGATVIGGSGAVAGSGTERFNFTGCKLFKSNGEEAAACKVNSVGEAAGTIKTAKLSSTLAYETSAAANGETTHKTLTVLKPEPGERFVQIELTGEGCPPPGKGRYYVEGELIARNVDAGSETAKHVLEAPTLPIKQYWVNSGGSAKEESITGLKVMGSIAAIYSGKFTVEQTSGEPWSVTP